MTNRINVTNTPNGFKVSVNGKTIAETSNHKEARAIVGQRIQTLEGKVSVTFR